MSTDGSTKIDGRVYNSVVCLSKTNDCNSTEIIKKSVLIVSINSLLKDLINLIINKMTRRDLKQWKKERLLEYQNHLDTRMWVLCILYTYD